MVHGPMSVILLVIATSVQLVASSPGQEPSREAAPLRQGAQEVNPTQNQPPEEKKEPYPPIEFSMDNDPVLIFELSGGFRMRNPPGFKETPRLTIFKDGTVECGGNSPRFLNVESKIAEQRLVDLLNIAIHDARILETTTEDIKALMKQQAVQGPRVMDASTAQFSIKLEQGEGQVGVYALTLQADQYPDIPELQGLKKLQDACNQVFSMAHFESHPDSDKMLKELGRRIKQEFPGKMNSLGIDDLKYASQSTNGKLTARFERTITAGTKVPYSLQASIQATGNGKADIKLFRISKPNSPRR